MTSVADVIGADGAAGRPELLKRTAAHLERSGGDVAHLNAALKGMEAADWRSQSRARFDKLKDQTVNEDLQPIEDNYARAVDLLRRYASRLDDIQHRAGDIARQLGDAHGQAQKDKSHLRLANDLVNVAHAATVVTTLEPGPRLLAEAGLREAKKNAGRAQAAAQATQGRIHRLEGEGRALSEELDQAAAECAAALDGLQAPASRSVGTNGAAAIAVGAVAGAAVVKAVTKKNIRTLPYPARPVKIPDLKGAWGHLQDEALRTQWNATPGGTGGSAATWARTQIDHDHADDKSLAFIQSKHPAHPWGGNVGGWSADCILFARTAWEINGTDLTAGDGTAVPEGNAIDVQRYFDRHGGLSHDGTPPEGALVFFPDCDARGHVAIADGSGGIITTHGGNDLVDRKVTPMSGADAARQFGRTAGWVLPKG